MGVAMSKVIIVDWKYLKEVLKIPWCRQHWRRLGLEGKAPASIKIGEHRTGWLLSEVESYLQELVRKRDEQSP